MEMCGHATVGALWLLRERGVIADGVYTSTAFRVAYPAGWRAVSSPTKGELSAPAS